jgi:hypothetical protein
MALVVEDGTGKTDAETYISQADATTYHATYTGSAEWVAASSAAKDMALRKATIYLDLHYARRWRGSRTNETQALAWPRSGVWDDDVIEVDDDVIPVNLKRACAEVALRVILGDDLQAPVTEPGDVISESVAVGPISESKTYSGPVHHDYEYPKIEAMIAGWIGPAVTMQRA